MPVTVWRCGGFRSCRLWEVVQAPSSSTWDQSFNLHPSALRVGAVLPSPAWGGECAYIDGGLVLRLGSYDATKSVQGHELVPMPGWVFPLPAVSHSLLRVSQKSN